MIRLILTEIVTLMASFAFLILIALYWIILEFIDGMKGLVKR